MTAPTDAVASSDATRATALLMPEAMPAFCSSASARIAAVSGATVIDSPSENTTIPGSTSIEEVGVLVDEHQQQQRARRADQRPDPHEEPRAVAVGHRAEAPREQRT